MSGPAAAAAPHQAVVLCAGEGRRLRPFTSRCPKPLLPFLNVPLLEHVLAYLERGGVRRVALNAWHLADQVEDFVARRASSGLELHVERETELLGTGGGLRNLLPWMDTGPVLVSTADILTDVDLGAVAARHAATGAEATMVLAPDADVERFGAVEVDDDDMLTDIVGSLGRPGRRACVNASVHVFERGFLERLPEGPCCLVRQGYLPAMEQDARCAGMIHAGAWAELGNADALLAAQRDALAGTLPVDGTLLARGGHRDGAASLVHPSARVADDALLDGGSVIGADAEVGAGARVHASLLLPGARVASGATIEHTILDAHPAPVGSP
ncbi:MAG: nucleotidyltransferase family protein [Planctomycetota bacterium]|jgi:mannose-1-phosphate guanylyltransferase